MKYLSLLIISISMLSCKEDIAVSPPPLMGSTWFLVESRGREMGIFTSPPQDFKWQKFERFGSGGFGYEFQKDTVIEIDYPCQSCYNTPFYHKVAYMREDSTLKITSK